MGSNPSCGLRGTKAGKAEKEAQRVPGEGVMNTVIEILPVGFTPPSAHTS